jgi:uncharacterized RDD family membrane protein YckC
MNPPAAAPPLPLERAPSLRRRMACWLYEGTLLFGLVMLAGLVLRILTNNRHALQGLLFVVLGWYFVYFWSKGQTLPMKTWRIRIVTGQGQPLRWPRALLRYVLSWVWLLPPLALAALAPFKLPASAAAALLLGWVAVWALLSRLQRQRQFWHDIWAGTRLIDVRPAATARR